MHSFDEKYSLVLPGGGARGAYQVGVLKAVSVIQERQKRSPFQVISGTSAGAINASVISSKIDNFDESINHLENVWKNFSTEQIYKADKIFMLKQSLHWLLTLVTGGVLLNNPKSLLDNSPLRELLKKKIDFESIQNNLLSKELDALIVTAASYNKKQSVSFFSTDHEIKEWEKIGRVGRQTMINIDHLMASVALPLIFPAISIDGQFFGDGAMRQETPLSPSIRLGARKLFIISTESKINNGENFESIEYPSFTDIGGYVLDGLFSGSLYADLERLDRINQIIEKNGSKNIKTPSKEMHYIDYMVIAPSKDINQIAMNHFMDIPITIRMLFRGLGIKKNQNAELLSFLMFESSFSQSLIALGYDDAMSRSDEIKEFLRLK